MGLVVQRRAGAAVRLIATPPVHADHLQPHAGPVHVHHEVVVGIVARRHAWPDELLETNGIELDQGPDQTDEVMAQFRDFLDQVSPEDF